MVKIKKEVNGVETEVTAQKIGNEYDWSITSFLSPLPISYVGRSNTLSDALVKALNCASGGISESRSMMLE